MAFFHIPLLTASNSPQPVSVFTHTFYFEKYCQSAISIGTLLTSNVSAELGNIFPGLLILSDDVTNWQCLASHILDCCHHHCSDC